MKHATAPIRITVFCNYLLILALLVGSFGLQVTPVFAQGSTTPVQINGIFNPDIIYPSQTSRLTINVYNPNLASLSEVNWTDTLPDDLVIVDPANPMVSGCGNTGTYTLTAIPGTQIISLSGASVAGTTNPVSPGICSVTVSVTSFDPANHTNIILTTDGSVVVNVVPPETENYDDPANITLLVLPMSNPTISKGFTPADITADVTSCLVINIRNNDSNVALTGVALTDTLPGTIVIADPTNLFNSCNGSVAAIAGEQTITLANGSIPVNQTCSIEIDVVPTNTGTFTNIIGGGTLTTYQKVTYPNDASATLVVKNLDIQKSFNPVNFQSGGTSEVTITITNPTVNDLANVHFTDTLPAGLTATTAVGTSTCGGTVDTTTDSQEISFSGGSIAAGGTCTVTATVTASTVDTFTNTLSCTDLGFDGGTAGCSDASSDLDVYGLGFGLTAVKSFSPENIAPGAYTTLTIDVTAPADTDLSNVALTDSLPANVTVYSTPAQTQTDCGSGTFAPAAGDSSISLTGGVILAGETCRLTVRVTSTHYGPHTNTILTTQITNDEDRHIADDITATFTVRDISVTKNFASSIVGRNGRTTLSIRLTNNFNYPLSGIAFTDTLPGTLSDGIIIATPSNLTNSCNGSVTAVAGTQTISLSGGSIPAPANTYCTITLDVQGTSEATPPPGTTYTNTIAIGGVTGLVNGTTPTQNWHATSDDLTVGSPDFRINKKFDPILVTGDTASTMTITLVNTKSSPVSGIRFVDTLPDHMLLANPPSPSVGTCGGTLTPATNRLSFEFSGGSLPANGQCKLTIRAIMDVTGNTINEIPANSVTTTQGATNLQSTSATLTNLSSVSVIKKFDPNPVSPGGVSRLTLTITKVGIGIGLTGLGVTDTLTDGLTIASAPASTNTCGGTLSAPAGGTFIELTGGAMPIGMTTCTVVVSIMTPDSGVKTDGYSNCIPAGTIETDQGYTNIMETCDTLGTIFDPPTGIKVLNSVGLPELEWRMVWINNHNLAAINVQISDPIPTGTSYVDGSLTCQVLGTSSTTTCDYIAGTQSVFWEGNIGEDSGATNEATADNEVIITFRVTVPNTINAVNNRATSLTDTNDDGDFGDETTPTSVSNSNIARWSRFSRRSGSNSDGNDASILPNSGFAPDIVTILPEKPVDVYRSYSDLRIEIPTLNINTDIVGLPMVDKKWDVTWLGSQLGYLEETAFPTWNGNSVITGHVYDANGKPGPFINLKDMRYGDPVIVQAYGQNYRFEVREVLIVAPNDIKAALKHQEQPWITLLTCQGYSEKDNSYSSRVLVRAVLVKVEE